MLLLSNLVSYVKKLECLSEALSRSLEVLGWAEGSESLQQSVGLNAAVTNCSSEQWRQQTDPTQEVHLWPFTLALETGITNMSWSSRIYGFSLRIHTPLLVRINLFIWRHSTNQYRVLDESYQKTFGLKSWISTSPSVCWGRVHWTPLYLNHEGETCLKCFQTFVFQVEQSKVLIKEGGVQLTLTIVDTPGFGDAVDNSNW